MLVRNIGVYLRNWTIKEPNVATVVSVATVASIDGVATLVSVTTVATVFSVATVASVATVVSDYGVALNLRFLCLPFSYRILRN